MSKQGTKVQLTLDTVAVARMTAARQGLAARIAGITQSAFVEAAIHHYANQLADEINNGKDWLTGDVYNNPEAIRDIDRGKTAVYAPVVDWARVASKRLPPKVELHRQLNGARLLVAVIYPDTAGGKKKTTAYQKMLKAAGYEVDPERDEHQDDEGQILIPIRPRQT